MVCGNPIANLPLVRDDLGGHRSVRRRICSKDKVAIGRTSSAAVCCARYDPETGESALWKRARSQSTDQQRTREECHKIMAFCWSTLRRTSGMNARLECAMGNQPDELVMSILDAGKYRYVTAAPTRAVRETEGKCIPDLRSRSGRSLQPAGADQKTPALTSPLHR